MIYSLESAVDILLSPKGWLLLLIYGFIFIAFGVFFIFKSQPNKNHQLLLISFIVSFVNIVPFLINWHIDDVLINVSDRVATGLPIAIFLFDFLSVYIIGLVMTDKRKEQTGNS